MIFDKNMTINNVLRMVYFLVGNTDQKELRERLFVTVKHEVKRNRDGNPSSYNFDRQDLWDSFFMKDEVMKNNMENRRISSMEELEMRTWEYVESNRDGNSMGGLFPYKP